MSTGPLNGIRVVDLSRFVQGPFAAALLADWGADVIKVEAPEVGELGRRVSMDSDGYSSFFETMNRGKRSLTLNLKSRTGLDILRRLVSLSDILIENFTPGVMDRLGIGYDEVQQWNPRLIYASGSGYGPLGPHAADPMFDQVALGVSGLMDYAKPHRDGEPHVSIGGADPSGAVFLALGIVTALYERERSGVGQHVNASLVGACIAMHRASVSYALRAGEVRYPKRRSHSTTGQFQCSDGQWLVIAANDQPMWLRLCSVLGRMDLTERHEFRHGRARTESDYLLEPILEAEFRRRDRDDWIERLRAAHVPVGPINSFVDLGSDADAIANEYVVERKHARWGDLKLVGSPVQFSRTPAAIATGAPELGADTADILSSLHYSEEEIAQAVIDGAI